MTQHKQTCNSCGTNVNGEIYHLGFSNMDAIYCTDCPKVLLLEDNTFLTKRGVSFPRLVAGDSGWQEYDAHLLPYFEKAQAMFPKCTCGGRYEFMAPPRCPKCRSYIFGQSYENKPTLRNHGYAFVTEGSVSIKNGAVHENT